MQKLLPLVALLSVVVISSAQDGAALLKLSMEKSGNWDAVQTLDYTTKGQNYNKWQAYHFQHPAPMQDEATRSFDFSGKAYYFKTISRYGGGYVFEFVNIGKDTTRYAYDVQQSRTGRQLQKGGKRVFDAGFGVLNESLPYYALRGILQSGDTLQLQNDSTVRRRLKDGAYDELEFSKDGNLSKFTRVQNGQQFEKRFSGYRAAEGLQYPQTVAQYNNGELVRVDAVSAIALNVAFNRSLLEIPADYQLSTAAPTGMKVSEIAKDVFLIEAVSGGRNVLFINMDDFIVATEAPVSTDVSASVIELIRKTVPGKPIRYVHVSHFHNDHSHGLNAFLLAGASVLATPPTISALKTIVPKISAAQESFTPFKKTFTLKDSRHELQFYEIKNTHAEGLSFLYLPRERIIYEGDLYSVPDDGTLTPAIEITRDFDRFIRKNKLAVNRIIGHHGHSHITPQLLQEAVRQSKK